MTTTRMLRLNTPRSMASAAARAGGVATPKPNERGTLWFHIEGMLGGLASAGLHVMKPKPVGWGPSELLETGPVFDLYLDFGSHDATEALVEFVLGLVVDADYPSGLLVDPQIAPILMWDQHAIYLFETDFSGHPRPIAEEFEAGHEEFCAELHTQLTDDVVVESRTALPEHF